MVAQRPNTSKAARAARQRRNGKLRKSQLTRCYLEKTRSEGGRSVITIRLHIGVKHE